MRIRPTISSRRMVVLKCGMKKTNRHTSAQEGKSRHESQLNLPSVIQHSLHQTCTIRDLAPVSPHPPQIYCSSSSSKCSHRRRTSLIPLAACIYPSSRTSRPRLPKSLELFESLLGPPHNLVVVDSQTYSSAERIRKRKAPGRRKGIPSSETTWPTPSSP